MDDFKSAMVDFLKFQREQQKRMEEKTTWAAKKKKNWSTPAG